MYRRIMALLLAGLPATAMAETELSFYTGYQTAPHSVVRGTGGTVDGDEFSVGWDGRSFEMPPYYGLRATWWRSDTFGWGVELNHAKVYAPDDVLTSEGYDRLEFTDGLNLVTVNAYRRWPSAWGDFTPYVGGGAGLSVPHVDIEKDGTKVFEYQITGPAVVWVAGASYPINDDWSVFGEYKGSYSMNTIDMGDGGEIKTDIVTNALNLGVSFSF